MNALKNVLGEQYSTLRKRETLKHTERVEASMLLPKGREESQSPERPPNVFHVWLEKKFAQFQNDDAKRYKVSLWITQFACSNTHRKPNKYGHKNR